jgi:hypothetical protein
MPCCRVGDALLQGWRCPAHTHTHTHAATPQPSIPQARLAASEGALSSAEAAAASAASQCADLSTEVASLAVVGAASQKNMATRNCMLKDGLRQSEARVRALAEDKRRRALEAQVGGCETNSPTLNFTTPDRNRL